MHLLARPLVCLALVTAACGGGGSQTAGGGTPSPTAEQTGLPSDCVDLSGEDALVVAADNDFKPICIGIAEGQDVTVRNDGAAAHTFTIADEGVDEVLQPGEEVTVEALGDVVPPGEENEFQCRFHAAMVGYLNVVEGS